MHIHHNPMRHRVIDRLSNYQSVVASGEATRQTHIQHGLYATRYGSQMWSEGKQSEASRFWQSARQAFAAAEEASTSEVELAEAQCYLAHVMAQLARLESDPSKLAQNAIDLVEQVIAWLQTIDETGARRQLASAHSLLMSLCYGSWAGWPWEPDSEMANTHRLAAIGLLDGPESHDRQRAYREFLFDAAGALMCSPRPNARALSGSYLRDALGSAWRHRHLAHLVVAIKLRRRLRRLPPPSDEQ